ncbi:hypothetical protein UFOVP191_22 [uncultured Caudovirales phage]|uniref:VRR-NUC domain containing protein n=1 Tax=uncultured Caudovirales phage TaxID=2100421 RepID=A0A6J7WFP2_9CAUD|nr:hypothetical protein UFOVP191_22 [uncultured Caudovirales phage]
MRRCAAVDANQSEIVGAARKMGFSVTVASMMGNGFPDLVLGKYGLNFLVEVKDGSKFPSQRKLTIDEQEWHDDWQGQKCIIECLKHLEELHELAMIMAAKMNGSYYKIPAGYADGSVVVQRVKPTGKKGATE